MEQGLEIALKIIAALVTIITGSFGLVKGWFGFRISSNEGKRTDFELATKMLFKQLSDLREENVQLKLENTLLHKEISDLRDHVREIDIELRILRAGYFESPLATWVKDEEGKMLFLSEQYEKLFLLPIGKTKSEYIGNTDDAIWGEETAKEFTEHDQIVRDTGEVWLGIEKYNHLGENLFKNFYFMKYPFNPDGKGIIRNHVAGIALPLTDEIVEEIKNNREK